MDDACPAAPVLSESAPSFKVTRTSFLLLCNAAINWHWHEEAILCRVVRGTVRCRAPGISLVLQPGDHCFINANALHMIAAEPGSENAVLDIVLFDPALIALADTEAHARWVEPLTECRGFPLARLDGTEAWQKEVRRLFDELCGLDPACFGYELRCRSRLTDLWLLLAENTCEARKAVALPENQLVNELRARKMLAYIRQHFQEDLSIDAIASAAGISRSECFRCFKRAIGKKPIEYLNEFRVERAVEMLKDTDTPISDICSRCGFSSPSYFGNVFRGVTGMPPRNYRQRMERLGRIE